MHSRASFVPDSVRDWLLGLVMCRAGLFPVALFFRARYTFGDLRWIGRGAVIMGISLWMLACGGANGNLLGEKMISPDSSTTRGSISGTDKHTVAMLLTKL